MQERGCLTGLMFQIFFWVAFLFTLWGGARLTNIPYQESWVILGDKALRTKVLLIVSPLFGTFFGMFLASSLAMSDFKILTGRAHPLRFFLMGWSSFLASNIAIFTGGAWLFVGNKPIQMWLIALGEWNFKLLFFLIAPTAGFVAATIVVVLTHLIIAASRT